MAGKEAGMMRGERRDIGGLPSALSAIDEILARLEKGAPAVFLDFDGTLAPITSEPSETSIPAGTRAAVERLGRRCFVAVVSGRDLDDVRARVGVDGIHYAGSHGFDVLEPDGERHQKARDFRPDLERAADELDRRLEGVPGAFVERKGFALAVHYRQLENPSDEAVVEEAVDRVAASESRLRKTGGKKIFEVRPDVEWHKGKAVEMMLGRSGRSTPVIPLYLGDDLTDEDAFEAVAETGVGIVVRGEEDDRPSWASYSLEDAEQVRLFLERLAEALG